MKNFFSIAVLLCFFDCAFAQSSSSSSIDAPQTNSSTAVQPPATDTLKVNSANSEINSSSSPIIPAQQPATEQKVKKQNSDINTSEPK